MRRSVLSAVLAIAVFVPVLGAMSAGAQEPELDVDIDPGEGADATTVTITGSGAPAGEEVVVSFAPWDQNQQCDTPRDGETVETVTADENGNFSATHTAERYSDDQVGNTYFAYVPANGDSRQMSNLECFEFAQPEEPEPELSVDVDPNHGESNTNVTISGSGAPAGADVIVSHSPWNSDQACTTPRDGETVETVTADENGQFSATHTAERYGDDQVGNTYFAYLPVDETPQPKSNLECFVFESSDEARHFDQTGYWVTSQFLDFWDNNGGIQVFGYPLSEQEAEDGTTVQYFERQRFELHPENEAPFDVLLGHLGNQAAEERELLDADPFQPVSGAESNDACLYFEETGHRVCHGFKNYWQSYGLDLGDEGVSLRESVMLFGYPISEEFEDPETGMVVQYFERGKLEYHPDNEAPWDVIPERLGAKLYDR